MLSNDTLVKLVKKVRDCPFLKKYNNILKQTPHIHVIFVENKGIELYYIGFNDWDDIHITSTEMVFYPEHAGASWPPPREVILSYENWEELCAILGIYDKDK